MLASLAVVIPENPPGPNDENPIIIRPAKSKKGQKKDPEKGLFRS